MTHHDGIFIPAFNVTGLMGLWTKRTYNVTGLMGQWTKSDWFDEPVDKKSDWFDEPVDKENI